MRRTEKEITSPRLIEDILARGELMRLGLWDGHRPYVVPVNYAYQDGRIYLHSSREGKKARALAAHPDICFEVTVDAVVVREPKPCGFTAHFKSVIGYGRAAVVEDAREKRLGLALLMSHYGSDKNEFPREIVDKTLVVRIDIESMTGKCSPAPAKDDAGSRP
ncbi:MAG: pyridoxamine 5'-phosphate oxidase family protein [Desulfovibrionaceae bacterium]|nr:pyridoxamine 5'-phosphate oxidase family protein [Desulfovibrionaceae bacterium]MBF0513134.1 pyridoxamine 5'-phosphate oxidase family protein [Desulfovibrionaceae bacterium]